MFSSSSNFQISGGAFYDISGNLNLNTESIPLPQEIEALPSLDFSSDGGRGNGHRQTSHGGSHRRIQTSTGSTFERPLPSARPHVFSAHRPQSSFAAPTVQAGAFPDPLINVGTMFGGPLDHFQHKSPLDSSLALRNRVSPGEGPPKTHIHGGTFINHIQSRGDAGLHLLREVSASDAFHNAAGTYPLPKCHPDTRTEMLEKLSSWSLRDEPDSRVLWLYGPAGAGKSAIALSFCQKLEAEGQLGATFFFKRGHLPNGNGNKLFVTIAYQLALLKELPNLKYTILRTVEDDPSILDRSLSIQLKKLIIQPCQQLVRSYPLVIVIDGLDECEGRNVQQDILRSIGNAFQQPVSLRLFISSRPEPHIREAFSSPGLAGFHSSMNINQSFEDVHRYLQDEFTRIQQEHHRTMATVPMPWPSSEALDYLVKKSSGYFIYAATVIKFVDDKDFRPTQRLDIILGTASSESLEDTSPFSALDQLYIQILSQTRPGVRSRLLAILTVITAKLKPLCVFHIEQLLGLKGGDLGLALRHMHSVLKIPESMDDICSCKQPLQLFTDDLSMYSITVHHASFRDFLDDPTRSGAFHIGGEQHTDLVCCILKAFAYTYDNPSFNHIGHVAWSLASTGDNLAFQFITSVPTSPNLLSLLQSFNPDFLFNALFRTKNEILDWLTICWPLPEDLILLWEDYHFMLFCDASWSSQGLEKQIQESQTWDIVGLHVSPQLIKILSAYQVLHQIPYGGASNNLLKIHILLDLTWHELRMVICPLRAIIGKDDKKLKELLISGPQTFFSRLDFDSLVNNLCCGFLWLIKQLIRDEVDRRFSAYIEGWGLLLRSCPTSPMLLQDLADIQGEIFLYRCPDDSYHVVQWLKTFSKPPFELIAHFEYYLETQLQQYPTNKLTMLFEADWRKWRDWRDRNFP
ncbi:hypothetical protein B0H11DRAFT_2007266 [Mycena galericulata]|nr:hypothetical protein B0H11DRAFT_2007266 [Mycena galericulata]